MTCNNFKFSKNEILELENDFLKLDLDKLRDKYGIKDGTWKLENAKKDLLSGEYDHIKILIKPFDLRYTLLNRKSSGFLGRPRFETMKHMLPENNFAILLSRQNKSNTIDSFFITKSASEMKSAESTIQSYHFPLYVYNKQNNTQVDMFDSNVREPNLDLSIIKMIEKKLNLFFIPEDNESANYFSPTDILDYIYATLYSPKYRTLYKDFLKIDFPIIPYPEDKKIFWPLVKLGGELRTIHLLENPVVEIFKTKYPIDGSNLVDKVEYTEGKVYINKEQYFDKVSEIAWNFYIGGYQPAQKWLKDRKGRELSSDDILHYQRIIVALTETDSIMKEIDEVIEF